MGEFFVKPSTKIVEIGREAGRADGIDERAPSIRQNEDHFINRSLGLRESHCW